MTEVGWVLIARAGEELARRPAVRAIGGPVVHERAIGEWRELRIPDTGEGDADLAKIVAEAGTPALLLYVVDARCAVGEAAAPGTYGVDIVLGFDVVAADYSAALPDDYLPDAAASDLGTWAQAAGLAVDADAVRGALAHGSLDDLYAALGIARQARRRTPPVEVHADSEAVPDA